MSRRSAFRLVGLALFALVLTQIDIGGAARALRHADWADVALALLLGIPFLLAKSERWRITLAWVGSPLSRGRAAQLFAVGLLAGLATPGQVGEFSKAYGVQRDGGSLAGGIAASAGDRSLDLVMLAGLSGWFALTASTDSSALASLPALVAVMAVLGVIAAVSWAGASTGLGHLDRARRWGIQSVGIWSKRAVAAVAALTVAAYVLYAVRVYLLLVGLGGSAPAAPFIASMAVVSLVALLPISIAGIGSRDAAVIAIFAHFGMAAETAVAFSLLVLSLYVFNALLGLVGWMTAPGPVRERPPAPESQHSTAARGAAASARRSAAFRSRVSPRRHHGRTGRGAPR